MYTTEALVCGTYDHNTSDRSYLLFTKELGMLYATARSVREERSRQRHALQDFSVVRVSLVRGKGGWRIGSVVAEHNVFQSAPNRNVRTHVTRVVRTLRRYVRGEEAASELYTFVVTALIAFSKEHVRHPHLYVDLVVLRILYVLGYVAPSNEQRTWIQELDADITLSAQEHKAVQAALEHASTVSHL